MASSEEPNPATRPGARPTRVPLSSRSARRWSFESRLRVWLTALAVPGVALIALLTYERSSSVSITLFVVVVFIVVWALAVSVLFENITRPLQTLSNVVAALREDDFSFRARGAQRGDSLGDLALEINALASTLQQQRVAALDALTLVEIVMNSMPSPVFAFDGELRLRLLNPAAEKAFNLRRLRAMGSTASELDLMKLLADDSAPFAGEPTSDPQTRGVGSGYSLHAGMGRWSVYRTTFRLEGVPHTLLVLADLSAALREEERVAWQRLIRVLGHEINNSLTPIKSIAGSLRARLSPSNSSNDQEQSGPDSIFERGLTVIEDRAESLNRFLQAYQKLSRLPTPSLQLLPIAESLRRAVELETRLTIDIATGSDLAVLADPDQLQQLLINLIRNAADAALASSANGLPATPIVEVSWLSDDSYAVIQIVDNGDGLLNEANLFVPFYTTKPGGTGIGLVLSQQIAVAHNGSVTLRNRADRPGCIAEVRIPRTPYQALST